MIEILADCRRLLCHIVLHRYVYHHKIHKNGIQLYTNSLVVLRNKQEAILYGDFHTYTIHNGEYFQIRNILKQL